MGLLTEQRWLALIQAALKTRDELHGSIVGRYSLIGIILSLGADRISQEPGIETHAFLNRDQQTEVDIYRADQRLTTTPEHPGGPAQLFLPKLENS